MATKLIAGTPHVQTPCTECAELIWVGDDPITRLAISRNNYVCDTCLGIEMHARPMHRRPSSIPLSARQYDATGTNTGRRDTSTFVEHVRICQRRPVS